MDVVQETLRLLHVARNIRHQTGEDLPMMAYLVSPTGGLTMVQGLDNGLTPTQRSNALRSLIAEHKPVALILIYEAWMANAEPGASRDSLPARLSDSPKAREVLIGSVETRAFKRRWEATIQRGRIGDFVEANLAGESGAMAGLLYVEPVN